LVHLPDNTVEPKKLIVGPGISLSGEINACERLVVEGSVQANLQDCRHMTITDTGLFNGNAAIDDAEVHGRFEGDLVVRHRLLICATGRVSGTISYGQIEIEAGGRISGSIQAARESGAEAKAPPVPNYDRGKTGACCGRVAGPDRAIW